MRGTGFRLIRLMGCLMDSEKMPTASAAQLHVYAACNHSNPLSGRLLCLAQKCRPSPSRHKRARHDSSSIPHHLRSLVKERRNLGYYVEVNVRRSGMSIAQRIGAIATDQGHLL